MIKKVALFCSNWSRKANNALNQKISHYNAKDTESELYHYSFLKPEQHQNEAA
jgi:hypothetical protein